MLLMEINLTQKQYWDLLRSVYIADWVANAICDADMKRDDEIKAIRNYIFSYAKEMGYEKYVDFDEEDREYYATVDLDDEASVRKLIERYDEHSAWDELAGWLGERDFFRKYNSDEIKKMTDEERFLKRMDCEIIWETEFEEFGIERIEVDDMEDSLKEWHKVKDGLIKNANKIFFHEREIWWCSLGKNIGFEQNGKGEKFTRPVIVIKRLSLDTCLVLPLTTSKKRKNLSPADIYPVRFQSREKLLKKKKRWRKNRRRRIIFRWWERRLSTSKILTWIFRYKN